MTNLPLDLTNAELEVLKVLWEDAPRTVRDVMNALHEQDHDLAYTTVLTFLSRLEQKGFVKSDKSLQAYTYRPLISREKVTKARLRSLVEELFDGAAGPLVLQLVRDASLSRDELSELHELVDQLDQAGTKTKSRGKKR